ncbi:MAG: type II toxin-antitoxin system HicA family toxin [Bacteroidales bacterium]|nr:type II toxin-antitoxin system HicA family toxin [Bacteroidales bacterium]
MKYSELERLLKRYGCYQTGMEESGHPLWYSPLTKNYFAVSHHHHREVANGTLLSILKLAGIRL